MERRPQVITRGSGKLDVLHLGVFGELIGVKPER